MRIGSDDLAEAAQGIRDWAAKLRESQGLPPHTHVVCRVPTSWPQERLERLSEMVGLDITVEPADH